MDRWAELFFSLQSFCIFSLFLFKEPDNSFRCNLHCHNHTLSKYSFCAHVITSEILKQTESCHTAT